MTRKVRKLSSDSFGVGGFIFGNIVANDCFAGEGIPKEPLFAIFGGGKTHAAGNYLFYIHSRYYTKNML